MKLRNTEWVACLGIAIPLLFLGCSDKTGDTDTSDTGESDDSDIYSTDIGDAGDSDIDATRFEVDYILASDIVPSAPGTVGIVTWSIQGAPSLNEARIEFGLDTSYGMTAPVDLNETGKRTLLLGMKPDRSYHFKIVAVDETTTYMSPDYVIETGPPTDLIHLNSFKVFDETKRERGFILASFWLGDSRSTAFIIDPDGEIVWWYETDLRGICRAVMSEDGKNMWMVVPDNGGGFLGRVTLDGLDYETYPVGASHDITPVHGATMAYLDFSETDCNSIFEIDPSGNPVEVFESEGSTTARCHANALRYSQTEDVYTFSNLDSDILIVNRSGRIEWRLSDIVGSNVDWGSRQHGHHLLDNSIVIFANNVGVITSAVIEYDFNGNEILYYDSGLFTQHLGDVQRLPGGNTVISYSDNASFVHEIDPKGNLVLEIDARAPEGETTAALGYTLWRESLYGPPPDILL